MKGLSVVVAADVRGMASLMMKPAKLCDDSLSADYGPSYFRTHCGSLAYDRAVPHWGIFFGGIAETIIRSFRPSRVFDAGCAMGFLMEAFWDRGVEAWGRDISEFAISQVRADLRDFCCVGSIADLIEDRFDLITCIEVLEHMPEAAAVQAIEAMTAATDRILFSSSPRDLQEPTHINVKPTIYWLRLFAAQGFAPLLSYDPTFVTPQCIVLERVAQPSGEQILLGYSEIVRLRLQHAERDESIRELSTRKEAVEQELQAVQQELATLNAKHAEALAGIEDENSSKLAVMRDTLSRLEEDHNRILTSTSWRMTYVLRHVAARATPRQRRLIRASASIVWWSLTLQLRSRLRQRREQARAIAKADSTAAVEDRELDLAAKWYLTQNPDVAAASVEALQHYRERGGAEGRSWGLPAQPTLAQQKSWYLLQNPDVAAAGTDAVQHFVCYGAKEGRAWPVTQPTAAEGAADKLPWIRLLNIAVLPALAARPTLNVLVPTLAMRGMSGGPNTAVSLACRLAATGIKVRLVSTQAPLDQDTSHFWDHATKLADTDPRKHHVELVDASYRGRPFHIGENDLFMATAWWTAQAVKHALRHTRQKRFLYLIQDYECLLHPASTEQALADETYRLDHLPIINTALLHDFLVEQKIGRFAESKFAKEALTFEPAVDVTLFYPSTDVATTRRKRRLLFYVRPSTGLRNLFELGLAALRKLVNEGAIDSESWEICGMGEPFEQVALGSNCWLVPLPWVSLATYAQQMRESDLLLSLMLSPHPSYPPLEMAACGRPVVTTVFGNKDAVRLAAISPNIIAVEPTLEAIADGILLAMRRSSNVVPTKLPTSWSQSLDATVSKLHDSMLRLQGAPERTVSVWNREPEPVKGVFPGFDTWPADAYGLYRQKMLSDRAAEYKDADPGLLSFITPVWNTPPDFLGALATTVFGQDSGAGFEWLILDNDSVAPETRAVLAHIAENPTVRLFRVDKNLGIVAGLRYLLERACNRYIVPLDHDDLLTPDCVRILTSALRRAGFPLLAYSDEDKTFNGQPRDPYSKPDFDPVLFTHSCYIAHLCAIDRESALRLGCYTNLSAEGSPDWDSFTRFVTAGYLPLHVPEIVYTWRMHPQSTALNIGSKGYIHESQRSVLQMFLAGRQAEKRYTVELSSLFNGSPDWRFVRNVEEPPPVTTVLFGPGAEIIALTPAFEGRRIERVETEDLASLLGCAQKAAAEGRYLHLLSTKVTIDDGTWANEALAMFDLYPSTAMVGGRIHQNGIVIAADSYFGFDGGCNSPNLGRPCADPGYFAQMWKPHAASAVPTEHCVIEPTFLVDALTELIHAKVGAHYLSAWLGAAARVRDRRCIYSPFLSAAAQRKPEEPSAIELAAFKIAYADLIPDRQLLSPRVGLTRQDAYQPVLRSVRLRQEHDARSPLTLPYPEQHAAELMARRLFATSTRFESADLSVLTVVYAGTDPVLFHAAAASVLAQTIPFREWVLLAQGPIPSAIEKALDELHKDQRIRILLRPANVGIIRGMRICLEEARARFVAPLDGDDLLTEDALQFLMDALTREGGADFVFSDEDVVCQEELQSPIRRTRFDPILNDADSTIWHFCGFERERALQLGVFSDDGAEACQDWDTVQRFTVAGAKLRHAPHVLYHWRHHAASVSNSGKLNDVSIRSVRHVLSGIIARQRMPDLYEIRPYPLFRGVEQLALLRRRVAPLPFYLVYITRHEQVTTVPDKILSALPIHESCVLHADRPSGTLSSVELETMLCNATCEYLIVLDEQLRPCNDEGAWDAMRLFEMHDNVAAVGGRILDAQGLVAACAETLAGPDMAKQWVGRSSQDPGPFALAFKPQTATRIAEGYFFCRTEVLRAAISESGECATQHLARRLTEAVHLRGMNLAYSPLVEAEYCGHQSRVGSD
jgi:O-antigen biosynthesis protein